MTKSRMLRRTLTVLEKTFSLGLGHGTKHRVHSVHTNQTNWTLGHFSHEGLGLGDVYQTGI